jgi:AraC-like DNA-binding protein
MIVLTYQGLLAIIALSFVLLLMIKVAQQRTEDIVAKTAFSLFLLGLAALEWTMVYGFLGLIEIWPRFLAVQFGLMYWMGPALYAYIRRITSHEDLFEQRLWFLHWLPGIVVELILLPVFLMPVEEKLLLIRSPPYAFLGGGVYLHFLIYIYLCQKPLRLYQRQILDRYSDIEEVNLRWLQYLCYGFVGFMLIDSVLLNAGEVGDTVANYVLGLIHISVVILAYSALGPSRMQFAYVLQREQQPEKYQRSSLREDSAKLYLERIERLMHEEKVYLDSTLSLNSLAERLGINPRHLSQILNQQLDKNFYDYINERRVEYAKELLIKNGGQSIFDVAFDAGYNNKSSFYNSFKRYVGMTPTAFRQEHLLKERTQAR